MSDDPFVRFSVTTLYHFTDRRNLPSVRELGGLFSFAKLKEKQVAAIHPGGNDWSQDADKRCGMDQYVHLCFRPTHPMEFLAREAKRIEESIFLQVHPAVLKWEGVMYSAGVSNKSGVQLYTIDEAKKHIDFEVLFTYTDWRNPAIKDRLLNAEKCEVLVPNYIPLEFIRNIPNG